jgi:hypothetical protein
MAKKYSITRGQYNAMIRSGSARSCYGCEQTIPRYRGRYPGSCTGCGGEIGLPSEVEAAASKVADGKPTDVVIDSLIGEGLKSRATRHRKMLLKRVGGAGLAAGIGGGTEAAINAYLRGKSKKDVLKEFGKSALTSGVGSIALALLLRKLKRLRKRK